MRTFYFKNREELEDLTGFEFCRVCSFNELKEYDYITEIHLSKNPLIFDDWIDVPYAELKNILSNYNFDKTDIYAFEFVGNNMVFFIIDDINYYDDIDSTIQSYNYIKNQLNGDYISYENYDESMKVIKYAQWAECFRNIGNDDHGCNLIKYQFDYLELLPNEIKTARNAVEIFKHIVDNFELSTEEKTLLSNDIGSKLPSNLTIISGNEWDYEMYPVENYPQDKMDFMELTDGEVDFIVNLDEFKKSYIMTAECPPKSNDSWFPLFGEGDVIEGDFSSQEEAQDYLNEQCRMAGTDEDEYFIEHGPYAEEE